MERHPISSVEEVREELKRLGYLESGLDRFVLGGAGPYSVARAFLSVAVRVGLAGGAILGAAWTAAAVGLDRRLLDEPRDLIVLFVYLFAIAGAALAVSAAAGGIFAAWLGRRKGRRPSATLARNVGLGFAALGILYLALWWRLHAGDAPFAVQLLGPVFAFVVAVLLGRFGALAAVAVLSAGGVADGLPAASLTRRHMLPLLAAAVVLLGGGVVTASYLSPRAPAPPDYAVVPTGLRVRVLGIDGLDPRLAERLMSRGEMPRLRELIERSAHARLAAEPEQVPAIVWTTIATGRGPEAHGIQAPSARRIAGMRTPLAVDAPESRIGAALATATDLLRITRPQTPTDAFRSVKTFWNVASEKGLRVGVVNWWATWPAEAVNGYMVTDRALIRLEKGGALDREVHPERIAEALRPVVPSSQEDRALAIDTFALEAARTLAGREPPDLEVLYLPGLDILTTRRLGDAPATDLATLETQLEAVHAHYRFLDDALGRWTETAGPRDVLVLVGDPGRLARRGAERAEGLLLLAGGAIEATDLGSVTERDIAPTVLHLIGMPISKELPGRVVEGALAPEFRRSHPVRFVATYGRRPPARPAESALDPQVLEELKSLGYIK